MALGRAVDLATLDARVRSAAIEDAHRGTLVYVSRAEPSHASVEARP
ncbi:hypothetical protein HY251_20240 [bacterium]|nr:hypothetical protein [bacterium]